TNSGVATGIRPGYTDRAPGKGSDRRRQCGMRSAGSGDSGVWAERTNLAHGSKPMAFSIVLGIASIGAICALLYNLAVYVLPVAVGLWTGFWAMDTGAGPFGGIVVGFAAGVAVFV